MPASQGGIALGVEEPLHLSFSVTTIHDALALQWGFGTRPAVGSAGFDEKKDRKRAV